jgi:hypothetical protein
MDEEQVIALIKQYSTVQGGTHGSLTVPLHFHRGPDAPQLNPNDFLPYPFTFGEFEFPPNLRDGSLRAFNANSSLEKVPTTWDWGFYFRANGIWNTLDLADFRINAVQSVTQTIANGATDVIIFDTEITPSIPTKTQFPPNGFYDATTGKWSLPSLNWYQVCGIVTINATNAGTFTIRVYDGSISQSIVYQLPSGISSLAISTIMPGTLLAGVWIDIKNDSGASCVTVANQSSLIVKQLK